MEESEACLQKQSLVQVRREECTSMTELMRWRPRKAPLTGITSKFLPFGMLRRKNAFYS